jgi:hypothetical protein
MRSHQLGDAKTPTLTTTERKRFLELSSDKVIEALSDVSLLYPSIVLQFSHYLASYMSPGKVG